MLLHVWQGHHLRLNERKIIGRQQRDRPLYRYTYFDNHPVNSTHRCNAVWWCIQ